MTNGYALRDPEPSGKPSKPGKSSKPVAPNGRSTKPNKPKGGKPAGVASPPGDEESSMELFAKRVRRDQLVYVTTQLAIMVETGITLSAAIDAIAQQEQHPTLRRVLNDLRQQVESGGTFSDALAKHPKLFDRTYISLVRASEATGTLAEMLERIAGYQQKELETRGKVRAAMAYPAVMLVLSVAVSVFLLTYIFPKFTPLFARKGMLLPLPTRVMMTISDTMLNYWYLWVAGVVAALAAGVTLAVTERGREILDNLKINVPVLSNVSRKVIISRSIRTLGTMLASGVPTLDALRLCGEVCGNVLYQRLWSHVEKKVTEGSAICAALQDSTLLPRTLVQMIHAGEETGKLDEILQRVSVHYDKEVENAVKSATSLIEPIMMCMMAVVIGSIALALMLPIFSLTKHPG